ncbi:hypothetical protein EMMF5_006083 [Cystobasidiomycetes sp. EMM_F5]
MQVDSEHGQQASSSLAAPKPSAGLRQLALELHTLRTAGQDSDAEGRNDILKRALPLFAMARSQLRSSATASRIDRTRIAATRSTMDAAFLALQSRKYEMNHLYREIEKCNDYDSIYQDVPLVGEQDFVDHSDDKLNADPHLRMVARLRHEVDQRQKAQAELKALLASKTKVIRETEARKASLEQLEKQLDDFVAFHEQPGDCEHGIAALY